jgi:YXWGXW repeat-containing protein
MKKRMTAYALTAMLLLGAGCAERVVYVREPAPPPPGEPVAVMPDPPPPPPVEVIPAPPGPAYVWVGGAWEWHNGWVWMPGRYYARPYPHAVWIGGHWARHGPRYAWVHGHWR